ARPLQARLMVASEVLADPHPEVLHQQGHAVDRRGCARARCPGRTKAPGAWVRLAVLEERLLRQQRALAGAELAVERLDRARAHALVRRTASTDRSSSVWFRRTVGSC